jgi:hypothetical protein
MAFGIIRNARKKRKERREKEAAREADFEKINQIGLPSQEESDELTNRVNQMTDQEDQRMQGRRAGYKQEAKQDLSTEMQGLTPAQRQAMQETANNQINNQIQNYSRMASSKMGAAGVRGGAANALQSEIMDKGLQATNQFNRDLTELDADKAMQKLAAYLTMVEGRQANDVLTRQQYYDRLVGDQQKKREQALAAYNRKYYKV